MSAQTGTPSIAPPPPSSRGYARVRAQVDHFQSAPNPVLMRELKQAARLTRTPLILSTVTIFVALIVCLVGGLTAISATPATAGIGAFQVFFSVAFFVVTLAGPTLASNSIAIEREGRTWEALQLTGLPAPVIARGKFLAAYVNIAMYILMLAPVGALPFLFGGVTALEVLTAFVWLFLLAGLSVAFGLAMSAQMDSARWAIVLALLLAVMLSFTIFLGCGVAGSFGAHALWPAIAEGPPVWLPTAYARAPFGAPYVVFLIILPALAVLLPGQLMYEITIANLTGPSDDRSSGVRRWFLRASVATVLVGVGCGTAAASNDHGTGAMAGISVALSFFCFVAFLFAGEPVGPSHRVIERWNRANASAWTRFLGPGVMPAFKLLLGVGTATLVVVTLAGAAFLAGFGSIRLKEDVFAVGVVGGYATAFFVFVAGFSAWMRARGTSAMARTMLLGTLFGIAAGPWIIAGITGAIADSSEVGLIIAAPSPFYVFRVVSLIRGHTGDDVPAIFAGALAALSWAFIGLGLLASASAKCKRIVDEHDRAIIESNARLDAEEKELAAAAANA